MAIRLQNQSYIHFHFLVIGLWTFKQPAASIRLSETLTSVALINHIIAKYNFPQYSINENKRLNCIYIYINTFWKWKQQEGKKRIPVDVGLEAIWEDCDIDGGGGGVVASHTPKTKHGPEKQKLRNLKSKDRQKLEL